MIPGLSNIKTWIIGVLTLGMSVLFALFKGQQAKQVKDKLSREKVAREAEHKATEALVTGLKNEEKAVEKEKDDFRKSGRRSHFE